MRLKIAFYSPFGTLREWRLQEILVAKACAELGHHVDLLECRGFQAHCIALSARHINSAITQQEKNKFCNECNFYKDIFFEEKKIRRLFLDNFLKDNDKIEAKALSSLGKKISIKYNYKGIPIGKISRSFCCIKNQEIDIKKMPKTSDIEIKKEIESSFLAIQASEKLFSQERYNFLFCQNGMYPVSRCISDVAEKKGAKIIALDNGILRHLFFKTIRFSKKDFYTQLQKNLLKWRRVKNKRLIPTKPALASIKTLADGKFFVRYSKAKEKNAHPKIRGKFLKKVLIVMSSEDELQIAKILGYKNKGEHKNIFINQLEWIYWLTKIAEKNQKILFIFRPHPRDWPNDRTQNRNISPNGLNIQNLLAKVTLQNVFLDLPPFQHSLYDLIDEADLILNSWSSAGEEARCLGKSVLTTFPKYCNYPPELTLIASSKYNYLKIIKSKLWEHPKRVKKYSNLMQKWVCFNSSTSEVQGPDFNQKLKDFDKPKGLKNKILKRFLPKKLFYKYMKGCVLEKKSPKSLLIFLKKIFNNTELQNPC